MTPSTITPDTIRLSMESESRRQARFAEVRQLKAHGATRSAIAQQLQMSVNTVARYLRADELLIRTPNPTTISTAERFAPYLQQRWQAGCHSPLELWKEIQQQGFTGSQAAVWRWVNRYRATRQLLNPEDQMPISIQTNPKVNSFVLSSRQASWILLHRTEELKTEEKKWLEQFEAVCELVVRVRDLAQQFTHMVSEKASTLLNDWIVSAKNSGVTDLRNFALGLQRDWDAVSNALKFSWSNGPTEGHVNRLKVIKRQMYGRASFDLLRCRVLAAG